MPPNLTDLDAVLAERARKLVDLAADEGIDLRITSGYRSPEEQARLYAQGRTTPGPIVTNARPGKSYHNSGRAIDVVPFKDGKPDWESPLWDRIGALGKSVGLKWGGNFRSIKDRPHFEHSGDSAAPSVLARLGSALSPRSASAATPSAPKGRDFSDFVFGNSPASTAATAPAPKGRDFSDFVFGDSAPLAPSPQALAEAPGGSPVAPLPPTPEGVRNPLAPGIPDDASPLQTAEAQRLMDYEDRLQTGTRAAREELPALGAQQVMTPGQTGLPEPRSERNPLAAPSVTAAQPPPVLTPELIAQGYGGIEDAWKSGQLKEWAAARLTMPQVWRQAMDTGARTATGIATGGMSLPAQVGGQMLTEGLTQVAGLNEPSVERIATAGGMEAAGNMVPRLALNAFQRFLRMSRGGRQIAHTSRIGDTEATARIARDLLDTADEQRQGQFDRTRARIDDDSRSAQARLTDERAQLEEGSGTAQSRLESARDTITGLQGEERAINTETGFQHRELRSVRPGFIRGMEDQLRTKAGQLADVGERTQRAVRSQFGRLGAARSEALMRQVGHYGPEVSEEAVTEAYRHLDDVKRLSVDARPVWAAVSGVHPDVREGMKEALSVIPSSQTRHVTFGQLRGIQTSIGKNIRALERSIARNMDDMNGEVRLAALKKIYASTFQSLDDTIASGRAFFRQPSQEGPDDFIQAVFPADTKRLLDEANTLNRITSMMDRVETMWQAKAISTVGGQEIFDADKLLRAIKGDAFLTRMLHSHNLYTGLTDTLGKIATAQKRTFKGEGVSIAGLQGLNQQFTREEALREVSRARASETFQTAAGQRLDDIKQRMAQGKQTTQQADASLEQQMAQEQQATQQAHTANKDYLTQDQAASVQQRQGIDQNLRETQARIEHETPSQQSNTITGDIARPLAAGIGAGIVTGRTGVGITAGVVISSYEGMGRFLLSKHGQRWLERLFARDPALTMPKIGYLLNAASSSQDTNESPQQPRAGQ